jgi:hypothetical protein
MEEAGLVLDFGSQIQDRPNRSRRFRASEQQVGEPLAAFSSANGNRNCLLSFGFLEYLSEKLQRFCFESISL